MSYFKIIPNILAALVSKWIFNFESHIYVNSVFQYLPGVHRILCLVILFSYKDFLRSSIFRQHSPPAAPYQPLKVLRKNSIWFLMLSSSSMTIFPSNTSAKGYKNAGIRVKFNSVCKGQFDIALILTSKITLCFWTGKWCNCLHF